MHHKALLDNKQDFEAVLERLKTEPFAYDTETNGKFSRFEVSLVGMSFGFTDAAYYVPINHIDTSSPQLEMGYVLDSIKPIFETPGRMYVAHNAKFDEMVLGVYGIECLGTGDDTYVMAWLLDESIGGKGLKNLAKEKLGVTMETYEDVISDAKKIRNVDRDYSFAPVAIKDALSYASDDAYYTLKLYDLFKPQLEEQGLWKAYEKIERPFNRVLRHMEGYGILVDKESLEDANRRFPEIADEIDSLIYEAAGERFNVGARQQLARILFEKLKIRGDFTLPRTKSGDYKTDKNVLERLAPQHEIVRNILRRKKIAKTHSTFVVGTKTQIEKDGRVRPSFNGCGTVTGRLSCRAPNMQNVDTKEVEAIRVRNLFVPQPGFRFVVADYSQIELRVLAHLSGDEVMLNAFNSGRDFHDETAREMLKKQGRPLALEEAVPGIERTYAKSLNFGIPYGRGPFSVGELLGKPGQCKYWLHKDKATGKWWQNGEVLKKPCGDCGKCFIETWFEAFPKVRQFKKKTLMEAKARGFVRTLAGRKRRLPNLESANPMLKGNAERQAFNTRMQGSAADILKAAMIGMEPVLDEVNAHMIIQIHDELVVECPEDMCEYVKKEMKRIMEAPVNGKNPLRLDLITNPVIVDRWSDAK